ncbi:hypothetical protein [Sphingobacterium detergens]|uniref:Uncharacterized protein n=1 Tax=Sphingobacterium detergens TaxID=1145106 RepID=A0A420BKV5_SPHD1|nr:hypothetical protein [Sphingobacterium detergens]RKE57186.1 hypothetical protein DFQ12_2064 [Sphingobacterium detergens]
MFSRSFKTQRLTKYLLLFVALLSLNSCSKKQEPVAEEPIDEFGYEVECTSCEITYTDKSNITKTIKHTTGKWEYRFDQKTTQAQT